jgi:hypothetical protein
MCEVILQNNSDQIGRRTDRSVDGREQNDRSVSPSTTFGRAQEGLNSPAANESSQTFLAMRRASQRMLLSLLDDLASQFLPCRPTLAGTERR